jgi:hypothetical protein
LNGDKVILPVWHGVTAEDVTAASPTLAARLAADTARGIERVADEVERALKAAGGDGVSAAVVQRPPVTEADVDVTLDPPRTPDEIRTIEGDEALAAAVTGGDDLYIVMDLGGTKAYVSLMTADAVRYTARNTARQSMMTLKRFSTSSDNVSAGLSTGSAR